MHYHQENLTQKYTYVLWWVSILKVQNVFRMIKSCISWEVNLSQTTFCLNCISSFIIHMQEDHSRHVCFVISPLIMCRDLTEECIDQNDAVHATHKHHIPMNEDSTRFNVTWPKAICTFLCLQHRSKSVVCRYIFYSYCGRRRVHVTGIYSKAVCTIPCDKKFNSLQIGIPHWVMHCIVLHSRAVTSIF